MLSERSWAKKKEEENLVREGLRNGNGCLSGMECVGGSDVMKMGYGWDDERMAQGSRVANDEGCMGCACVGVYGCKEVFGESAVWRVLARENVMGRGRARHWERVQGEAGEMSRSGRVVYCTRELERESDTVLVGERWCSSTVRWNARDKESGEGAGKWQGFWNGKTGQNKRKWKEGGDGREKTNEGAKAGAVDKGEDGKKIKRSEFVERAG